MSSKKERAEARRWALQQGWAEVAIGRQDPQDFLADLFANDHLSITQFVVLVRLVQGVAPDEVCREVPAPNAMNPSQTISYDRVRQIEIGFVDDVRAACTAIEDNTPERQFVREMMHLPPYQHKSNRSDHRG